MTKGELMVYSGYLLVSMSFLLTVIFIIIGMNKRRRKEQMYVQESIRNEEIVTKFADRVTGMSSEATVTSGSEEKTVLQRNQSATVLLDIANNDETVLLDEPQLLDLTEHIDKTEILKGTKHD